MAFNKRKLFCFFFDAPVDGLGFGVADASVRVLSVRCVSSASSSGPRFLPSSDVETSLIGHTKPVLGVYAGR